ncbi:uncharacterized protein LOC119576720 [Penaeus monodon]|uniref:uncharacterized protein LOC119576720 n=1 Tax=Penaeus monodon TaxID=6687 RepID=UPI0018A77DFE|nr:uncharacterized protein LOC119576720 [Penaeus monodon]
MNSAFSHAIRGSFRMITVFISCSIRAVQRTSVNVSMVTGQSPRQARHSTALAPCMETDMLSTLLYLSLSFFLLFPQRPGASLPREEVTGVHEQLKVARRSSFLSERVFGQVLGHGLRCTIVPRSSASARDVTTSFSSGQMGAALGRHTRRIKLAIECAS